MYLLSLVPRRRTFSEDPRNESTTRTGFFEASLQRREPDVPALGHPSGGYAWPLILRRGTKPFAGRTVYDRSRSCPSCTQISPLSTIPLFGQSTWACFRGVRP